ncbi:sialate O-acetylesterase [Paenibacillus antri]|uniref:Sialate O-acetylesterase n=1 Tax=Paenibacillus antri TaxID=2582848 RepID=A0A5R9G131_9BACL|nr:sialate O-acetylesterase [Paenibacillus antri]TLS48709.1 sialate O-acetylesterase [Paenibacillus antri]
MRVDPIFSDHMVLQRDKEVAVWGEAADGEVIEVECAGRRATAVAAGGGWRATLPANEAGGPYRLAARSGAETIVFDDVWYGDVWLAGGQSNMQWPLRSSAGGAEEIAISGGCPLIRYYEVPKVAYDDGVVRESGWRASGQETAGEFSAVAYHFAKRVHAETGVAIGIVGCNMGATSAACWVAEETLERDPALRVYLDEFRAIAKDFDWEAYEAEERAFQDAFAAYEAAQSQGKTKEELGPVPWPPPMSPRSFMRPNGLYETMLKRTAPYTLKGFLYYQGEGDAHRPTAYDKLLEALIRNWRRDWEDDALPFLYVQLPSFGCDGDPDGDAWALLRESQAIVAERAPHVAMAVLLDCGEKDDIHPADKKPVGERLARLALARVYGRSDVHSEGPRFEQMRVNERGEARLRFRCGGGRLTTRDGAPLVGFELCGVDRVYVPAEARIEGDAVIAFSDRVPRPIAARYGWANFTEANLTDGFGLPAAPFRTDREGRGSPAASEFLTEN